LALIFGSFSYHAHASSLYLTELNATDVALTGAGLAARANDSTTAFSNPAGMTLLEGQQYEVMAMPVSLSVDFETDANNTSPGNTKNADAWLPGGSFYYTSKLNDKMAWGIASIGYFGLGLDYDDSWAGRYYVKEATLQAVGIQPSFAYQITPKLSLGIGAVLGYTIFKQTLAVNNVSPTIGDGEIKLEDTETSVQINTGALYQFSDETRIGLQYLFETELKFNDVASSKNIGPGLTNIVEQAGLSNNQTNVKMTLPMAVNLSVFHQVTSDLALLSNITWQEWSEFGKLDVNIDSQNNNVSAVTDKKFNDTFGGSVGIQYQFSDELKFSTGVAYQESMVDDKDRTPDLPLADSIRFGIGSDYRLTNDSSVKLGYGLLFLGDVKLDQERGPGAGRLSGSYENMAMHFISLSYSSQF
jgi:long-chain fatty acid transport protein